MVIKPTQFEVHPSSGVPIYLQIIGQINALIAGGHFKAGGHVTQRTSNGDGTRGKRDDNLQSLLEAGGRTKS